MEKHKDEACDYYEIHEDSMEIINKTMPEETELEDLADLFKIFGDSTRIRILFVLFETEVCVCAVSYTHLDVYKRQHRNSGENFVVLIFP